MQSTTRSPRAPKRTKATPPLSLFDGPAPLTAADVGEIVRKVVREELARAGALREDSSTDIEISEPRPGLHRISWPGAGSHWLNDCQNDVVHDLLDALLLRRTPSVDEAHLLVVCGRRFGRLSAAFRGSTAWMKLVVPGDEPNTFRLPALPEPPAE